MLNVVDDTTTVARLRENLEDVVAQVKAEGGPLYVTDGDESAVVLLSIAEYQRLSEAQDDLSEEELLAIAAARANDATDLEEGIALLYTEMNMKPPSQR